jgi:putative tricarboxylic transport membrane protein
MLTDRIILVCTVLLAAVYFYATAQIPTLEIGDPLGPKAFPRLLGIGLLITAAVLFFEIRAAAKEPRAKAPQAQDGDNNHLWAIAAVTVWTGVYYAVFDSLGYIIATAAYLLGLTGYFHRGKWVANILVSVLFPIGTYLMFVKVFGVMLAQGVLKII